MDEALRCRKPLGSPKLVDMKWGILPALVGLTSIKGDVKADS